MPEKFFSILGAAAIVAAVVYAAVMTDASLCYQVAGCPAIRGVILGY